MTKREISPLEKIIRPIVEGQIRGFLKEHPSIIEGVDWYKPRTDKTTTFVNSLSKRIVRDLVCAASVARLMAAMDGAPPGIVAGRGVPYWRSLTRIFRN